MAMSNEVVLEFLELYKTEQLLWDPKHPSHRHRSEITDAWSRIQNSLSVKMSITDLKKKKESLMTSFRLHYNKKKTQTAYTTSWFAYPLMESFLSGKYECDSTSANHVEPEVYGNFTTYTHALSELHEDSNQRAISEHRKLPRVESKNSVTHPAASEILYAKKQMDEAVSTLKRATTERNDRDEYDLYGQLLAKKLKKLDERQRDVAMHDIDNIMFRAKMQTNSSSKRDSSTPVPRKMNSPVFISLGQQHQDQYDQSTLQYDDQST